MSVKCEPIDGLQLDPVSKSAIASVKRKMRASNALATALSVGIFAKIFVKSGPVGAAYNITQTDWSLYAQAMRSVPKVTEEAVKKVYARMIFHYQIHYDRKLLKFWKGLYNGCE